MTEQGDPSAGDLSAGDLSAGDLSAGDPVAGDPVAGDPVAGDPVAGDPAAGDHEGAWLAGRDAGQQVVLVRHAETEWSLTHRHTGRSDIPLTSRGRAAAATLAAKLDGLQFDTVLCSPARRARETCELCGLDASAQLRDDLWEWDYGVYEGLTTAEIQIQRPGWDLWRDGCPEGESAQQVGERADRIVAEAAALGAGVVIFSHGHLLRVLAARWIDADPSGGAWLGLATAAVSILGYERQRRVIWRWNA
jgi:probable phosphoglycerate mutase